MGQEGCRVYHCRRHTMVSKLKLDHNEVPGAFVQKYRRSVLPKSLRTHPDHTPHVDLLYSKKISSAKNFVNSDRQAVRQEFIFVKRRIARFVFGRSNRLLIVYLHIHEFF